MLAIKASLYVQLALLVGSIAAQMPHERAAALCKQMTLDEKVGMLHGLGWGATSYVGQATGVSRLGIPDLHLEDGPQGFRCNGLGKCPGGTSTQFPSGLTVAATWDVDACNDWGVAMGKEFFAKGANIQLGPGVCLARVPNNGRNFEYMSGEDPFLGYTLVQGAVKGIQSQKVVANAKHFVLNNQETNRNTINAIIDERTLFEMYLPPFHGAVVADVGSMMCSYNRVNGAYSCEQNQTLNTDLRERMGFEGFVMSDWRATHSTSIKDGLDQEMPGNSYFNNTTLGSSDMQEAVDRSVERILTAFIKVGALDSNNTKNSINFNASTVENMNVCRELSEKSMILLSNKDSILPLSIGQERKFKNIVAVGSQWTNPTTGGGGSGMVNPSYLPLPLSSLQSHIESDSNITVHYAANTRDAVDLLKTLDKSSTIAIVIVATSSSEGSDRKTLAYDSLDNDMITSVAAVQPNTVVVAISPGAILLPWANDVAGILMPLMPGQMFGDSLVNIIFGVANPSGKLPITIPNKDNEQEFTESQYPGVHGAATYSEKLEVGYRWYDSHKVAPHFPFGHGLSYTTFDYKSLSSTAQAVSFTLMNSGKVNGSEVCQLYIGFPESAGEPLQQLKGFKKVTLSPGETRTITLQMTDRDLSIWDVESHSWQRQSGTFVVSVGSSSRDIRLTGQFTV